MGKTIPIVPQRNAATTFTGLKKKTVDSRIAGIKKPIPQTPGNTSLKPLSSNKKEPSLTSKIMNKMLMCGGTASPKVEKDSKLKYKT